MKQQTDIIFNRLRSEERTGLFLFGVLIFIVLLYFIWQTRHLQQIFLSHSLEHSEMLASVIERNARTAVLSREALEEIIRIFLGNTAKFVDYLDNVEPFSGAELSAFSMESGLAGICVIRKSGNSSLGPENWIPPRMVSCGAEYGILNHLPEKHLFLLTFPGTQNNQCIILGFSASRIEKLHEQIGISQLVKSLSDLSGIEYVRIEKRRDRENEKEYRSTLIKKYKNTRVAETRLRFGDDMIILGMDTRHFLARSRQLRNEFFFFSAILAILGIFFSWLLHQFQKKYANSIRKIERELARQREDAALGRSAAAITHEIRNPLNAMSMGLQRLQMESDDLPDEYRKLINDILKALERTNSIVSNIRDYAKPLEAKKEKMRLREITDHILGLYQKKCGDSHIKIRCDIAENFEIYADVGMMEQVMENLIKNAVEAQILPIRTRERENQQGFIDITAALQGEYAAVCIENPGFTQKESEADRIFEAYFTSKTRGTGLGLSIVQKIVSAHRGRIQVKVPNPGILSVTVLLPLQ